MADWQYTFPAVSKEQWIQQIEKDLKDGRLHDLRAEWWTGEFIAPFHHQEDRETELVALPDRFFNEPPKIIEWINTADVSPAAINQVVLNALAFDAQSLVFNLQNSDASNFNDWIDGVETNMVDIAINIQLEQLEQLELKDLPKYVLIRLLCNSVTKNFDEKIMHQERMQDRMQFVFEIPGTGNWIDETKKTFASLLNQMTLLREGGLPTKEFLSKCIILFKPDAHYLKQVIQLRTLQLVWLNICARLIDEASSYSCIECHIEHNNPDPDQNLIQTSASAMAASLTGVVSMCLHASKNDVGEHYKRVNRNIHHLINLETGMYKGQDPLAGSHAIDYYTRKWSSHIYADLW